MKSHLVALIALITLIPLLALASAHNTAGNHVYASAEVSDDTGIVTTVATAGTYVAVKSATLFGAGEADGSSCIALSSESGSFTVANSCGAGRLALEACLGDVVGANNATLTGGWHRTRGESTTLVGPVARKKEPATATRGALGCVRTIASARVGDEFDFRFDSGTNADTVTLRQAFFSVTKLGQ